MTLGVLVQILQDNTIQTVRICTKLMIAIKDKNDKQNIRGDVLNEKQVLQIICTSNDIKI